MSRQTNLAIALVALVIGLTTFALTRSGLGQAPVAERQAPAGDTQDPPCTTCGPQARRYCAVDRWLSVTPAQREQIQRLDPDFYADVVSQREKLADERDSLAALLEDPEATSEEITQQVERSIELGNELERRVTKHLLLLRKILTADQQKRLFGLAASGVRQRMAWCGRGCGRHGGDGMRRGQGVGGGRGAVRGQGRDQPRREFGAGPGPRQGRGPGRGQGNGGPAHRRSGPGCEGCADDGRGSRGSNPS